MKTIIITFIVITSSLFSGIPIHDGYYGPTEQLVEREGRRAIQEKLDEMGIPSELVPFFDGIAEKEDWGHIGYHGANQGFRIYQDIIRMVMEEVLSIGVRDDFHFLRVPGDLDFELNSIQEFTDYWTEEKVNNTNHVRAKQLVSLNFGIYSNFDVEGSCSVNLFVKDISKKTVDYSSQLVPLFHQLGIPLYQLEDLFQIGRYWLDEDGGILLQISENSHLVNTSGEAYNFADTHCYPAKKRGYRYGSQLISKYYARLMTDPYLDDEIDIAPQLRLLINTRHTLNPNSHLRIIRWDLYNEETIEAYEEQLREYARTLLYNHEKVQQFRKRLLKKWL